MFLPVTANTAIEGKTVPVRGGVVDQVAVAAKQDVKILLKKGEEKKVSVAVEVPDRIWAPLTVGQTVCEVVVTFDGTVVCKVPAVAAVEVAQASWWKRWWPF